MRLGRKPIAIATTASTVATRMAAANILTSFSVAQSPRWLGALCQVCASLYDAACIKAVWLAVWGRPARPRRSELPSVPGGSLDSLLAVGHSYPSNRAKMPRPTRISVSRSLD